MSTLTIVLLVILVVLIAALIALYFFGKKAQKKQEEQQAQRPKSAVYISLALKESVVPWKHRLLRKKAFSKDYSTNKDTCKMPERIISQAFLFSL